MVSCEHSVPIVASVFAVSVRYRGENGQLIEVRMDNLLGGVGVNSNLCVYGLFPKIVNVYYFLPITQSRQT